MNLDALLGLWRAAPNQELADLVVELGAHLAVAARWDDLEGPPPAEAISPLLASLLDQGAARARERLELVAAWPRDPRIDRWVAAQYTHPPFATSGAHPFWTRLVPLVQQIADTQAARAILKARAHLQTAVPWQVAVDKHLLRATDALSATSDTLFATSTRTLIDRTRTEMRAARAAAATPERHADAAALFAVVFAHPRDDGARLVLGDVLHELGDPRGELIALQLGPGDRQRERTIVRKHAAHLLGALHTVLCDYRFERGFLARAALKPLDTRQLAPALAKVIGDPLWSTVEHLEGGTSELVFHPVMKSLRSLAHARIPLVELARLPNLVALTTTYSDGAWLTLADGLAFPALAELAVYLSLPHAAALLGSPLATRLAKLDLRVGVPHADPANEAFALLHRVHALPIPDATLRLVRHRLGDIHTAFRFTPGAVAVTCSQVNDELIADAARAAAILQNLGRRVGTDTTSTT